MKKVVVLQGNDSTGKTTALKMVVKMLLNNKARLIAFSTNLGFWLHNVGRVADIWAILEYKNEIVYITTLGDYPRIIQNVFSEALQLSGLSSMDIDTYVGAIHDTPSCQKAIAQIGSRGGTSQIVRISKTVSATSASYNNDNINDSNIVFNSI